MERHRLNQNGRDDPYRRNDNNNEGNNVRDINRRYENAQNRLLREYDRITNHEDHDTYRRTARLLGAFAAADDTYMHTHEDNENTIQERTLAHRYRRIATTLYDHLANRLQDYMDHAEDIRTFNRNMRDHNRHAPGNLQIPNRIENHIEIMNRTFNSRVGYLANPFSITDWDVNPIGPVSPLVLTDNERSSPEN